MIGNYKAINWAYNEITPPEVHTSGSYNTVQTDVFILGVLLFNMITPGYKPWAESATKDDAIFKYLYLDRLDLFEKYYEVNFGYKLRISKELFDILAFTLCY